MYRNKFPRFDHVAATEDAGCAVAGRQSQLSEATFELVSRVDDLSRSIDELVDRLQPVLRQEVENSCGTAVPPDHPYVPAADEIRNQRRRVESLLSRVGSVLERLEV